MKIKLAALSCMLALTANASAQVKTHLQGCSDAQKAAVTTATGEAMKRLWATKMSYAGIGAAMDKRQAAAIDAKRARTRAIEDTIFGKNDTDISFYITNMFTGLMEHSRDIRCAPKTDKECGVMRDAYVRSSERRVIQLCPSFFTSGAEQQTRTIVHEAAHSAGISESSGGESYCVNITCEDSCGDGGGPGKGTNVADNWSAFVHCASGQPRDASSVIRGSVSQGASGGAKK